MANTVLDNPSKYYKQKEKNPGANSNKEAEVKVLTKEEMNAPPPPAPPAGSSNKSPIFSAKNLVLAVIFFLLGINLVVLPKLLTEKTKLEVPAVSAPTTPTPDFSSAPDSSPSADTLGASDYLAQDIIQTHAECFEGACVETEGAGEDQCVLDSDCSDGGGSSVANSPIPTDSEIPSNDEIPAPSTPAAGSLSNTILGIFSGLAILLTAILL